MQGAKDTVKIGAVVAAAVLGIWGATLLIAGASNLNLRNTYFVLVDFDNARGLKKNMRVTAEGLEIGFVEWVKRDDVTRIPQAKIRISKDVTLFQGSRFIISQSGLIGDSELTMQDPPLEMASVAVKEGDRLEGTAEKGLQDMIARADQILVRVDNLLSEEQLGGTLTELTSTVNNSLEKVNGIAEQVDGLLRDNSKLITGSMQNLQAMSSNFLRLSGNLEETSIAIRDLATDPQNRDQLNAVLANLNSASSSLAATSASAEQLAGDPELQQNIRDTLRLTKEMLEETKKTVTQFQGTLGAMDGTLQKADGLLDSVGGAVDDARGTLGRFSKLTGGKAGSAKDGCSDGAGLQAVAGLYLRGIDYNASRSADARDRVVLDAKAAIGLDGKYIATGVDNIGDGGEINLLLGLGSPVSGGSARAGVYRGELGAGLAWYGGGFGAEVTAYSPQDPKLDAYGYVPAGESIDIIVGVEDALGSVKLTAGAGIKF